MSGMPAKKDARTDDLVPMDGHACPICSKPTIVRYRPFCSKRCADVDLQRWFTGGYAVPVVEEDRSIDDGDEDG